MKTVFNILFVAFLAIGTFVFSAVMPEPKKTDKPIKPLRNLKYNELVRKYDLNCKMIQYNNDRTQHNIEEIKLYQTKLNQNDKIRN